MIKIIEVKKEGDIVSSMLAQRDDIERAISEHGAVILRGLNVRSSKQFGNLMEGYFDSPLLSYHYRSTPRTELKANVYTSTEYPPDQHIPQHNENAYTNEWPLFLGFFCLVEPKEGGATPVCNSHSVYNALSEELINKFESKQLKYVRNYSDIDLSWQVSFQTEDKQEVEAICKQRNIDFEWITDSHLRTSQTLPATQVHPVSGKKVWFNQAHLFHFSSLPTDVQEALAAQMSSDMYPRNVFFADGSEIPTEDLRFIREVYEQHTVFEPWQKGDVMLVDNMLCTHGRQPYSGARKVLVGMTRPHSN
ncbi:TauD/TfdA family dioxygenase [Pseudoalteromonas umbrosa]|uniref:TauD/TfdA family dioxygenase n=1 Tax=Pseudoalteromonas umbrosa TaxID=3048489 RepID=UPI0024C32C31|nr:TauD/TfdA family dioxygenase [Pseudoalteromonas sp. B95]MDK1288856.1 TauD/TfdA family dioxygenase [Pseudoalteromonas sp. B95]